MRNSETTIRDRRIAPTFPCSRLGFECGSYRSGKWWPRCGGNTAQRRRASSSMKCAGERIGRVGCSCDRRCGETIGNAWPGSRLKQRDTVRSKRRWLGKLGSIVLTRGRRNWSRRVICTITPACGSPVFWIHTLKLPWELGADWFLRHLLDGDPASNTLSWRWVAGLHTAGKNYLATRLNVRRYTQDRFEVTADLAKTPVNLKHSPPPPVRPLQELPAASAAGRTGILLTDEDVSASAWLTAEDAPAAVAGFFLAEAYEEWGTADHVVRFRKEAVRSALGKSADNGLFESVDRLADWLKETQIEVLLMAEPPVGIWTDVLPRVTRVCKESGVQLSLRRHGWDTLLWPHATHGFFRFKKVIPQVVARLDEWEG